jgi:hypothetical protein
MRVTTDLWVSALMRRVFAEGGFAAVVRRGATESGAVFVLLRERDGMVRLFGPAPQTSYDAARPEERLFAPLAESDEPAEIEARLEKEQRFDPDIWVVEIETGNVALGSLLTVTTP